MALLPEDMLLEIFKRLQPPADVIRCAAVCRSWRSVISACASSLPAPPRHFGFFYNYSFCPRFVCTKAGFDFCLDRLLLPVFHHAAVVVVEDCRGGRLLLRELFKTELRLIVCDPLERSSVRLPPVTIPSDRFAFIALVPKGQGFRVAVVLLDVPNNGCHFHNIWVYHSASDSWDSAECKGDKRAVAHPRALVSTAGQSIVVGGIVYKLQQDGEGIVAVNTTQMTLFLRPLPAGVAAANWYHGNRHCIGKTADGRLCFFALREPPLRLVTWVLQGPGTTWVPGLTPPVALRPLMSPSTVGDLHDMELSHVCFRGFCEGNRTLFFVMAGRLVALDLSTLNMEVLCASDGIRQVYPYEMLTWPPVLKGFTKSTVLD